jgi:hypothetical protein
MDTSIRSLSARWFTSRPFLRAALIGLAVAVLVEGYLAIVVRENDFLWHWGFGLDFLAGDPYGNGHDHYALARGMLNALTAWMPYRVCRSLYYVLALGGLAAVLYGWNRLANRGGNPVPRLGLATAVLSVLLLGPYLIRDLDECGLQLILLFFLSTALFALTAGRPIRSGFWLALAVHYKLTPALFLPYLLWKRQFRAAGSMIIFTVLLSLAPALYLGWDKTLGCHRHWLAFTARGLRQDDPSETGVEPPRHRNQSLPLAIARCCQTYPAGHPLALDHPGFVQFGNLDGPAAKRVVQGSLLALAALLAWRFRKTWSLQAQPGHAPDGPTELAKEWAAVLVLCALLSPLCWLQHLVLVLPCVFLCIQTAVTGQRPRWHGVALGLVAVITLLVHGDILGRQLFEVVMSYKPHTMTTLLLMTMVLTLPATRHATVRQFAATSLPRAA